MRRRRVNFQIMFYALVPLVSRGYQRSVPCALAQELVKIPHISKLQAIIIDHGDIRQATRTIKQPTAAYHGPHRCHHCGYGVLRISNCQFEFESNISDNVFIVCSSIILLLAW
jgi:hypothetical protein